MARPFIEGLKYFPFDVDIFEDGKVMDMNLEYGILGEMVYFRMLTLIYRQGYYLEMSIELAAKTLIRSMGNAWVPGVKEIKAVIKRAAEIGLFDEALMDKGVFTSKGIQKQFVLATRRRRIITNRKYWLLDDETMLELSNFYKNIYKDYGNNNPSYCNNNPSYGDNNDTSSVVNVTKAGVSVYKSTQKEKEKKKERDKDKKDKEDKVVFNPPKIHFITQRLIQNNYLEEDSIEIGKYNKLFIEAIDAYGYDDVLVATDYIVSFSKNPEKPIEDNFAFLRKSLINNLEMFKKRRENNNESIKDWFKRLVL